MSRQASQAGGCWSALILCGESLCFALRTTVAVLSSAALNLPPSATRSLHPQRGFLVCGKLSSFTAPSQWCRSHPYSFVSVFFFFLLPYPGTWGVSCLLGRLSSASIQLVFCRSCSTCRCISDVFLGRTVISTSYSSAILKLLSSHQFYTHQCVHVNPNLSIHHTTTSTPRGFPPFVSIRFFSTSVSQYLLCKPVHLYHFVCSTCMR